MDIFKACLKGNLEVVKELVSKDTRLADQIHAAGMTPLQLASYNGHLPVVEFLVSIGVDVNSKGRGGWTALHMACSQGHLATVKFLVSKGANPIATTNREYTPLNYALANGHLNVLAYLEKQHVRVVFIVLCPSRCMPHDLVRSLFTYFL
jgi:ankyrin repeat protein